MSRVGLNMLAHKKDMDPFGPHFGPLFLLNDRMCVWDQWQGQGKAKHVEARAYSSPTWCS